MSLYPNAVLCKTGVLNSTYPELCSAEEMLELIPEWVVVDHIPWLCAMLGSLLVGLSGVLPLLVFSIDQTDDLKQGESANTLKTLLSFAVGGILGDVFLHSLPEIWANDAARQGKSCRQPSIYSGLLILTGLIVFVVTEKLFSVISKISENIEQTEKEKFLAKVNNNVKDLEEKPKHISGYLNLLANAIDNFTHGLSLGGAFLVSTRIGCLTTFAILVHEVPHEVGDFAILLKSGFTRWDAAKYQIITAGGGLIGSLFAIACSGASTSMEARTSWILPFTAGTFLHIALVTVLPDLLKEEDPKESLKQFSALLLGIVIMAMVTIVFE